MSMLMLVFLAILVLLLAFGRPINPLPKVQDRMTKPLAYKVLDIPTDADEEKIKEAYRRLLQKLHPDQGGSAYLMNMVVQAKNTLITER